MATFKKYERKNEGFAYTQDSFREGDIVWRKSIKINGQGITKIVGSISGLDKTHTAIISVHVKSLDNFGEDLAREERFIIHQKDFNEKGRAIEHLLKMEKETIYK
jgi:hypothetical protein